jgi:chromosome partitioning protein
MRTITCGKTTLTGHLAVAAALDGAGQVAVADTDPQGSLTAWWNARQSPQPFFGRSSIGELPQLMSTLADRGVTLTLIDTPPAFTDAIRGAVALADLVVVPTRPSPHDLRTVGSIIDLIEEAAKPLLFVPNGAAPRARITTDAAVALSENGAVAPVIIHQRTPFASRMTNGGTVIEDEAGSRGADEIRELWEYLFSYVDKRIGNAKTTRRR